MGAMNHTTTDCRTDDGIAVGLIDGIISMARVLVKMNNTSPEYREALKDLRSDEDIKKLLYEN